VVIEGGVSVWAQYTIEHENRDGLALHLKGRGVPTASYYPVPMHKQTPYAGFAAPGGLPVSEAAADRVLSLPMHAYLEMDVQDEIISAVRAFNG
jgi:UDP-2-acetamido-2-deoxy-ribo-hexuluronate aminotransferase